MQLTVCGKSKKSIVDSVSHAAVCRQAKNNGANCTVQYNGANAQVSWSLHHIVHVMAARPDCEFSFFPRT